MSDRRQQDEIEEAAQAEEDCGGWLVARVECRICSHEHVSVHPVESDEDTLECPACHCRSSEILEHFPADDPKPCRRLITGMDLVRAARGYLDTPFKHQGRLKGAGVDCVGLVICAARDLGRDLEREMREAGFTDDDFCRYSQDQDLATLRTMVASIADPDPVPRIGSILIFKILNARSPHMGIKTEHGVIHAFDRVGRVAEHRIDEVWERVTDSAWRLKEMS